MEREGAQGSGQEVEADIDAEVARIAREAAERYADALDRLGR